MPPTHAHLVLPKGFARFAQQAEAQILGSCLANKEAWFRRPLDDDALKARFKEFYKKGHLKVKLPKDTLFFDDHGNITDRHVSTNIRCLLQLTRVCFGRTEFGVSWSMFQAQATPPPPPPPPPPKCMMIDPPPTTTFEKQRHQTPGAVVVVPPSSITTTTTPDNTVDLDVDLHEFL